ncbi:PD-(D/E)XK nuclease family protein [Pleurocapsa sp. PCC 7319]|uniref:PD-(D/E)XK nuclease family protein n=1 Tax=Pleurocapsa sp. PCC 7319 TaxID=118161 RepID=UPI000346E620|nr:PD-(D/E)XK nuclease family protein [Pleurocapsa sp. PCC 7319]
MRKKLDLIRLSQSHLNLLSICPPRFQQVFLDSLGSLPDPQQEDSLRWGNRFHLLMQQKQLGLPITSLLESDSELDRSITALIDAAPHILSPKEDLWREAEHCRTLRSGKFLLTVIYDLLVAEKERATIFDWKTYRQPPRRDKLAHDWQNRLYLYVLAETSDYAPEQIKMIYWFVKSGKPQSMIFNYSQPQHQQTEQDLADLLINLETWWQNYQDYEVDFPHRTNCQDNCPYSHLLAEESKDRHQEWIRSINEIEEISI